jgi:sterol desaturase/sphingolipid hydroxylase (fatty acid hydroxylase superfamily)
MSSEGTPPILDARLLPYLLPYPLVGVVVAAAAFLFPPGPLFQSSLWSERVSFVVATFVVHESLWLLNAFFVVFDKLRFLSAFKIRRPKGAGNAPSDELLARALRQQLISHLVTQTASLWFLFLVFVRHGSTWVPLESAQLTRVAWQVTLAALVNDLLFYACHVALHSFPLLYKRVHSVHHQFVATTGFAAEYAHPLEAFLGNQLPAIIVPVLLGFQFDVWLYWLALRLLRTYLTHSGYRIPLLMGGNAVHHDWHHTKQLGNYGGTPLFDLVFGTYNAHWFRATHVDV